MPAGSRPPASPHFQRQVGSQCLPVTRPRVLLLLRLRVGLEAEVRNLSPRAEEPGCGFPTLTPGTLLPRIQSSWGPWSVLLSSEAVCCLNQPADDLDLRASSGNRKERDSSACCCANRHRKTAASHLLGNPRGMEQPETPSKGCLALSTHSGLLFSFKKRRFGFGGAEGQGLHRRGPGKSFGRRRAAAYKTSGSDPHRTLSFAASLFLGPVRTNTPPRAGPPGSATAAGGWHCPPPTPEQEDENLRVRVCRRRCRAR